MLGFRSTLPRWKMVGQPRLCSFRHRMSYNVMSAWIHWLLKFALFSRFICFFVWFENIWVDISVDFWVDFWVDISNLEPKQSYKLPWVATEKLRGERGNHGLRVETTCSLLQSISYQHASTDPRKNDDPPEVYQKTRRICFTHRITDFFTSTYFNSLRKFTLMYLKKKYYFILTILN